MKKKLENLKDLFIEQGRELYDATSKEIKELPGLQQRATHPRLREIIGNQRNTADDLRHKLEKSFKVIGTSPKGEKNECCESIINKAKDLDARSKDMEVRDAAIINSVQRLNHNQITALGSLTAYAGTIGEPGIASMLHETLEDQKYIDTQLSELAENEINSQALTAVAD